MITESVTNTIQCQTQAEYDQAKAKVASASLQTGTNVTYDDLLKRIVITVSRQVERL